MTKRSEQIDVTAIAKEIDGKITALGSSSNTPTVRRIRREFSKQLKDVSAKDVLAVAKHLLKDYGRRWVAYELIYTHSAALKSIKEKELKQFAHGLGSWGAVDTFAVYLSGPAWREKQISDKVVRQWARSDNRWWRRAALVSTVSLNVKARGGIGDTPRTLKICGMLVDDRDDMVVKALSWALRELIQHDRKAVRAFLKKYNDRLAARVKREVRSKLTTGLKNPRKV